MYQEWLRVWYFGGAICRNYFLNYKATRVDNTDVRVLIRSRPTLSRVAGMCFHVVGAWNSFGWFPRGNLNDSTSWNNLPCNSWRITFRGSVSPSSYSPLSDLSLSRARLSNATILLVFLFPMLNVSSFCSITPFIQHNTDIKSKAHFSPSRKSSYLFSSLVFLLLTLKNTLRVLKSWKKINQAKITSMKNQFVPQRAKGFRSLIRLCVLYTQHES